MERRIVLYLLLFISINTFSQNNAKNKDAFNYYENIITAQQLLYENKPVESVNHFIDNFVSNGMLYFKDFVLSFQVAKNLKDTVSMVKLFELLPSDFKTSKVLPLFLSKINCNLFNFSNEVLYKKSMTEKLIDSLFILDQSDRLITYSKCFFFRRKSMLKWDSNSKERISTVINYMGNILASESDMGRDTNYFYHRKFYTIIMHYPNAFEEFKPFFDDWLNSGKMHPIRYSMVADFYQRHRNKLKPPHKSLFSYGYFLLGAIKFDLSKVNKKKLYEVNNNRKKIGLPTLQHDLSLMNYIRKNKLFYFTFLF